MSKKARNYLCTWHGVEGKEDFKEGLERIAGLNGCRGVAGQLEVGEDTLKLHGQIFVWFKEPVRLSVIHKAIPKLAVKEQKYGNLLDMFNYVHKLETAVEGTYCEFGELPDPTRKYVNMQYKTQQILEKGPVAALNEGIIGLHNFGNIKKSYDLFKTMENTSKATDHVKGIYIYGPSGIGKSRMVRDTYKADDVYDKPQNKWFDGYLGQRIILIDDFDHQGTGLSHYLKRWADHYPCTGETKGGIINLNHDYIIITSQYKFCTLYTDQNLIDALERRFLFIDMRDPARPKLPILS